MIRKKYGFTLIELILVISIAAAMSFLSFQKFMQDQETSQANAAGEQLRKVGEAVNSYVAVKYDKLSTLANSDSTTLDPGPRTCDPTGNSCIITLQTLINEGILPPTYTGVNSFNSGYTILLKRTGTAPYYNVNGLVATTKPWIGAGNRIRYDLLGTAMKKAGIDSGITNNSTNVVSGYSGNWTQSNVTFSNINQSGQLAYQVGYGSYSYSIYLRRDGTLPMTGNLNMGAQSINNAKDITASGTTQSGILKSTGATTVGTTLNVAGATTLTGAVTASNTLNVAGVTTLAGTNVNGALNANSNFITAGTTNLKGATTLNSTLNVAGTSTLAAANVNGVLNANSNLVTAGTANLKGATTLNSTLNVAGTSTLAGTNVNGVLTANNLINASGNITSNGQVKGSTVVSSGRTTVGEYVQISGLATAGAACSLNGLQGRESSGALLSCVNGKWLKGSNSAGMYAYTGTTCISPNPTTGACSCPSGTSSLQMVNVAGVAGTSYPDPQSQANHDACMHASGGQQASCPPVKYITIPGSTGFTIYSCM